MRVATRRLSIALLALLALSCASANQLATQSDRELSGGNVRRAYEKARRALDKEPGNPHARHAMTAAAVQLVDQWKARILNLAEVDTVAAARHSLELRTFRGELGRYRIGLPEDAEFAERERRLRVGAANIFYRRGVESLRGHRPKQAWRELRSVREFDPGYRDSEARIRQAYESARTRVAILPFADQTGVAGLSQELSELIYARAIDGLDAERYPFTELIGPERVNAQITVSQLTDLPRDEALQVARKLGADRVVFGRVYGLRSSTESDHYHEIVYHRVTEKDADGKSVDRWVDVPFNAVIRERDVAIHYELEVADVRTRAPLDTQSEALEAFARVVWTDFQAAGDCRRYALAPAGREKSEPARVKEVEERWKTNLGGWTLPALLERARDGRERSRYQPRYRDEFLADSRARPVFLGELPSENDLALVALHPLGSGVLEILQRLDPEE